MGPEVLRPQHAAAQPCHSLSQPSCPGIGGCRGQGGKFGSGKLWLLWFNSLEVDATRDGYYNHILGRHAGSGLFLVLAFGKGSAPQKSNLKIAAVPHNTLLPACKLSEELHRVAMSRVISLRPVQRSVLSPTLDISIQL